MGNLQPKKREPPRRGWIEANPKIPYYDQNLRA